MELTPRELALKIAGILDKKLAHALTLIEVAEVTELADYFVICTGNSSTQVKALADELEFKLKQEGIAPGHIEGHQTRSWIAMDYYSVVVHIFDNEARAYYDLDRLWSDGKVVPASEYTSEESN